MSLSLKFKDTVSGIIRSPLNSWHSFFVAPDGSKEGWDDSIAGDVRRDEFVKWLVKHRRSGSFDWVEVQYGDDGEETRVCRDSDHPQGQS